MRVMMCNVPAKDEYHEAAAMVRRLLDAVDRGELEATSAEDRRMLRRLEGLAACYEVLQRRNIRSEG